MTDDAIPVTPNDAVIILTRLSRQLDTLGLKLHDAERTAVSKRHEFTVEKAKAFLLAEGSVQAREAQAVVDTAALKVAADHADAELRIIRSDIKILETRLDVGRSVVGVLRAEAQVTR